MDAGKVLSFANDAGMGNSSTSNLPGSACTQPGTSAACWTGPANERNVGACHDGMQSCSGGENPTWGPCTGEELSCGDAGVPVTDGGSHTDAARVLSSMCEPVEGGTGSAGGMTLAAPCTPGSSRWCDDGSCYWGQQQCQSDGTWGDCNDTTNNAGPSGCPAGSINYDENCCVQSGQCCAHAVDGNNYGSVGNCSQVDPCACSQLCAAGAVRWCELADDAGGDGTWGKQPCGADGTWQACTAASSVPSGCPSSGTFDQDCCAASGECCVAYDSEGSDPMSLNCPATACTATWSLSGDDDGGDYLSGQGGGGQGGQGQGAAVRRKTRGGHHHHHR
jgi:hypothetical protein